MLRIVRKEGSTGCGHIDDRLDGGIETPLLGMTDGHGNRTFVKADPPDLYMLTMLYQRILPGFAGDDGHATVSIDGLKGQVAEYYASWSGLQGGGQSQTRPRWVRRALDTLCRTGLAKRLPDGQVSYRPAAAAAQKEHQTPSAFPRPMCAWGGCSAQRVWPQTGRAASCHLRPCRSAGRRSWRGSATSWWPRGGLAHLRFSCRHGKDSLVDEILQGAPCHPLEKICLVERLGAVLVKGRSRRAPPGVNKVAAQDILGLFHPCVRYGRFQGIRFLIFVTGWPRLNKSCI